MCVTKRRSIGAQALAAGLVAAEGALDGDAKAVRSRPLLGSLFDPVVDAAHVEAVGARQGVDPEGDSYVEDGEVPTQ